MPKIGDELRAAREARHLSFSEVSEQLHIRSVYLEALEDENWALIGAPVYVRGFLRTYARYLGLEPEPAVQAFNETLARVATAAPERRVSPRSSRRGETSPWLWVLALAAAVLLGFVGYNYFELRASHRALALAEPLTADSPAPAASTQVEAAAPSTQHTLSPQERRTLEVRLTKTTWLLVEIDGNKQLEGTFPPGTRKAFHGKLADIRTGNAGGVDLRVNGKELGSMGHAGGVVQRRVTLDEE